MKMLLVDPPRLALIVAVVAAITGCAHLTTYNDKERLGGGANGVFIDAKQRVVVSSPYKKTTSKDGTVEEAYRRFCAEPSPDALSALAANLGVSATAAGKGSLDLNQGISEGAANIGVRTAAIQSLRDITYRDCEAYINGGITRFGLETLQRRFQSTLVAVLAIEQLTGAVRAPSVALTGQSKGTDAENLVKLVGFSDTANAALTTAKTHEDAAKKTKDQADTDLSSAQATLKATGLSADQAAAIKKQADASDADKKKLADYTDASSKVDDAKTKAGTAASDYKAAQEDTAKKQQDYDGLMAMRRSVAAGGGSNSVGVQFAPGSEPKALDKASLAILAPVVKDIVDSTLNLGFGREVCMSAIGAQIDVLNSTVPDADYLKKAKEPPQPNSPLASCLALLNEDTNLAQKQTELIAANTATLTAANQALLAVSPKASAADMTALLKVIATIQQNANIKAKTTPPPAVAIQ
jgi:hypothetical protein